MEQYRRVLFPYLSALLLILSGLGRAGQNADSVKIELPPPTGPHAVGRESFHLIDLSRSEGLTDDPNDVRELLVNIWYPADPSAKATTSPYVPNLERLKGSLDGSQYSILNSVQTHTLTNAKLLSERPRYQVLIFSHGNQMSSFLYTAIIEDLVSHGYIVAAIDHPYEALFTVFPCRVVAYSDDKRPKSIAPTFQENLVHYLTQRINERASDIVFVINQLVALNANKAGQFKGRLDLSQIGVFGHSNGGTAAARACQMEKRIRACINLDGRAAAGPFLPDENGSGPEQPFMYLAKPLRDLTDNELAAQKITRKQFEEERAKTFTREDELMRSVKSGSYRVIIEGATHESFSDEPLFLRSGESAVYAENQTTMRIIRECILAFFDAYLRNKGTGKLDNLKNQHAGVRVERFRPASKPFRRPQPNNGINRTRPKRIS